MTKSGTPRPAASAAEDQEPETGEPERQTAAGKMPEGHAQPGSTTSQRGHGTAASARTSCTERATRLVGMKEAAANTRAAGAAWRTS